MLYRARRRIRLCGWCRRSRYRLRRTGGRRRSCLERRFPDDYGKRTEVTGKDGGPVKVDAKTQHVFQPTPELWDEVLRKRAEYERLRDGDTDEDTASDSR